MIATAAFSAYASLYIPFLSERMDSECIHRNQDSDHVWLLNTLFSSYTFPREAIIAGVESDVFSWKVELSI